MPLSGRAVLKLFLKAGWQFVRQTGSHVRVTKGPLRETIPMHRELKRGMENYLLKRLEDNKEQADK